MNTDTELLRKLVAEWRGRAAASTAKGKATKPAAHATCQKCKARTYFTEEQLAQMPIRSEP